MTELLLTAAAVWLGSAIAVGVLWGLWRTVGLRIAARILDTGRP